MERKTSGRAGKLRLLYEANPMSLLVEQAGGAATDGRRWMLGVLLTQLHQRVLVFMGALGGVLGEARYHLDADADARIGAATAAARA